MKRKISLVLSLILVVSFTLTCDLFAQYPDKPVKMITNFSAGGSTDSNARLISLELQKELGVNFVVQNVVGSSGVLGTQALVDAKPDGYTIGSLPIVSLLITHIKNVGYKIPDNLVPISVQMQHPFILYTGKNNTKWETLTDAVEDIKANPGKYYYSSPGLGTLPALVMSFFVKEYDLQMTNVTFNGDAESLQSLMTGRIQLHVSSPDAAKKYDVKPLVVFNSERYSFLPDLPCMKEYGKDDMNFIYWQAIFAPKETPREAVDKLSAALERIKDNDEYKKKLNAMSLEPDYTTPEQTLEFMASQNKICEKLVSRVSEK